MTFLLATRNRHKVEEIRNVLGDLGRFLNQNDLPGTPEVNETGRTFAENARLKASTLARWVAEQGLHQSGKMGEVTRPLEAEPSEWYVLADDSGLEVDALAGAPGVISARYASSEFRMEGNAPDAANNWKLLRQLAEVPVERRTARFRCALALARVGVDEEPRVFEGTCEGSIGFLPRGTEGFGYDPLFIPEGGTATFAELGEAAKNRISHRARALHALSAHFGKAANPRPADLNPE